MPNKWDFVLVCDDHKSFSTKRIKKEEFLEELRKKGFIIKTIKDKKLFHGIRAPSSAIRKYKCLMGDSDYELGGLSVQSEEQHQEMTCTRIRIVYFILQTTEISSKRMQLFFFFTVSIMLSVYLSLPAGMCQCET
ncbi:anoctamin-9-like [Heteronotia binoei]|uniref:anoctamin-9-like n=1 Tax=Heteronotia binoei TaxID=13085 RepID=UPI00292DA9C9|nr:anoctamin-9-like [Heteronotia binoei]